MEGACKKIGLLSNIINLWAVVANNSTAADENLGAHQSTH